VEVSPLRIAQDNISQVIISQDMIHPFSQLHISHVDISQDKTSHVVISQVDISLLSTFQPSTPACPVGRFQLSTAEPQLPASAGLNSQLTCSVGGVVSSADGGASACCCTTG
jgi:hypothetical protein